eukprot:scaffold527538_cov17-Prasinocladus_malaysianus.AAC.1
MAFLKERNVAAEAVNITIIPCRNHTCEEGGNTKGLYDPQNKKQPTILIMPKAHTKQMIDTGILNHNNSQYHCRNTVMLKKEIINCNGFAYIVQSIQIPAVGHAQ